MMHAIDVIADGTAGDVIFRWAALLTGQFVLLCGVIGTYLATKSKVAEVGASATTAADNSAPVSNGYTKQTMWALANLQHSVERIEAKVDTHILDHAAESIKGK